MRPRLMRPDNFTPPTRTPWGGRVLLDRLKCGLELGARSSYAIVGESWEVSVEPSFPSRFADDDSRLDRAIAADPVAWLGAAEAARFGQTPLLVKLLDAADNLSVQVHPRGDDPALAADESGKPEGWYVLAAEPGAGLYLGFRDGVTRAQVERCVRSGGSLNSLMNFVPVAAGDAFVLPPGTAHAIGAGVTLLEPQLVLPGRRAVTYRFWDWNRTYDEHGRRCPTGRQRELHIERSLAVSGWHGPCGRELIETCRIPPEVLERGPVTRTRVISWAHFAVEHWAGDGELVVSGNDSLLALTCVAGAADLHTGAEPMRLVCGQSAVLPAAIGSFAVRSCRNPVDAGDGDTDLVILATRTRGGDGL